MSRLAQALAEAYAIAPADVIIFDTLEVYTTGVSSLYLTNGYIPIVANLFGSLVGSTYTPGTPVTFEPIPFKIKLPASGSDSLPTLQIEIDNVDNRLSNLVQTALDAQASIFIKYRPYLSTDLTRPQLNPPMTFYVASAKINTTSVVIQASFPDIVNKNFPNEQYNVTLFPGLKG